MPDALIRDVRHFNRAVTARIGVLSDRFLGLGRPLGEARLLWEIGPEGGELRALRARLGLDSAYVSRLLRSLEAAGLVEVEVNEADRRSRTARLTPAGLAERDALDRRSDDFARSLLEPLSDSRRRELVAAMRQVERLLSASAVEIRAVEPALPEAQRCIEAYFAELNRRSETPFDPAAGVSAEPHELRPPAGILLLAYLGDEAVGCGGLKHHGREWSEIKRMWLAESVRGLGVGRRMLAAIEAAAREHGTRILRLDTNHNLTEAIAMYRSAGYVDVPRFSDEPFADHWFEKRL